MSRRKPPEFKFLESGRGKKVPGAGQVTESGVRNFTGGARKRIPEIVSKFMRQGKRRIRRLERAEGKRQAREEAE